MNRFVPFLVLLCVYRAGAQSANSTGPKNLSAMEIELVRSLNSGNLQVGDEVLGKLRTDWTDGSCRLAQASVVHGVVKKVSDHGSRHGSVALEFRYGCRGSDPQKLIWVALLAPDPSDPSGHAVMRQLFRSPSFGEGGGLGDPRNTRENHVDMSGRQNATMPLSFQDGEPDQREQRPEAVKTGQVWKVAGVKLEVGKGPEESTTVLSTDGQVTLPPRAVLVLLPESVAVLRSIAGGVAGDVEASTPVVRTSVPLPPEIGACVEPACTVVHATNVEMAEPARLQTISLQHLGYRRLTTAEMRTLEYGAAVAFLGSDHLLFTYNPHTLVTREKGDRVEDRPHMVHAVLFDLRTGLAERTINWRVRNEAQYLWIVNGNEVLVHDGDRLRWLGSGLREEHALPLEGPLAFVRISPDRRHYVVGVAHELHSEAEHAELAKADVRGPEERIVIHMLDEELRSLDEGSMSSRAIPPLALDGGRLELRHGQGGHYYLRETVWNGTAHRDFARMSSACVPTVDTLSANLLAVEGCNDASLDHWYRVFREDGSPVLKSMVHWREFSPLIADDGKRDVFALAIPEARREYVQERAFRGADLEHELVRVHRASDGRELAQMRMRFPLPARQPVAFSPDGERVAVIDGEEIVLYDTGGAVRSH